jgi:gliding motility-associated-like protein
MRYNFFLLSFFICFFTYSQCFDCGKNYGGWVNENTRDLDIDNNGNVYLTYSSGIIKHDANCNVLWSKLFNNILFMNVSSTSIDSNGNIYLLLDYQLSQNANNGGPFNSNGIIYYRGLNLIKFDSAGNFIWNRFIGERIGPNLQKLFIVNDKIYITGTFYDSININNQISFNFNYTDNPRAFIAKYNINGDFINANHFGNGLEDYIISEIDSYENIYLTKRLSSSYSTIEKISPTLQILWSKEISNNTNNNSLYIPTNLYYNSTNNKLYLWGAFNNTVNVLGNLFTVNENNSVYQSLLTEFNPTNGDLERISRFDNFSRIDIYSTRGNTGYFTHKDNSLYILTSFTSTMNFNNQSITSASFIDGGITYFAEDLVLFKVNLNNFTDEFIFNSTNQTPYINPFSRDFAGPIIFNNNDLIITSTFTSKPIEINGTVINNNSGNQNSDVLFYKFNINQINSGEIIVNNTCINELTLFNLSGSFDSIVWDFGDPLSSNNSAVGINNPTHQYSNIGNYQVTATVTCQGITQTIQKEINITNMPSINMINDISECETVVGSGISSNFDTSLVSSQLIGNQQNVTIEFRKSNGQVIPSPLPNPYTNTISGGETIIARVFNDNNPECFVETTINFIVNPKPNQPTLTSPQQFCIQQNATLNNIAITGQNIKWYNALTDGNLLPNTTLLQNAITYYASQTINGCESTRVPVLVTIQNTPAPTGNGNQSFCSTENATLNNIFITGTNIIWYDSLTGTTILPTSTLLQNGVTYYASQTINGCESPTRLAISIQLINTLNANNYSETICDDLNNGFETVNLSNYNSFLIASSGNAFKYYNSLIGAQNQIPSDEIQNSNNYNLSIGNNIFYVRIESPNTCFQIVTLNLTLVRKPFININDIMPICEGSSITINAGFGYDNYLWSTNEISSSIIVTQPGNYSVTVSENHGSLVCSSTKNFTVVNSNIGTISEIITSDWTQDENTISVLLSSNSVGNYEYSLNGINFQDSNTFYGLENGEYTVFIRDKNGCGISSEDVYLLMYPKYFTPNGDGFNDYWKIKFSENEPNLLVTIFDRYGKLIKQFYSNSNGWDGTYNNKELPSTDYWFVVKRENGTEHKGHFSLKR